MSSIRRYKHEDHDDIMRFLQGAMAGMGYAFLPDEKDADIRDLASTYLMNRGDFYVVDIEGRIQGTVGVRRWSDEVAELKRLYVDQASRAKGFGHALCLAAIHAAKDRGYSQLRLDTTWKSVEAVGLFRKLGFREIDRYNDDPFAELFMEKRLFEAAEPPP